MPETHGIREFMFRKTLIFLFNVLGSLLIVKNVQYKQLTLCTTFATGTLKRGIYLMYFNYRQISL